MVYNPPRNGQAKRKTTGLRTTEEQDQQFLQQRLGQLKKDLSKLDPKQDSVRYRYIENQIKSIEKRTSPSE